MKLEEQKKAGILNLVLGAVLFVVGLVTDRPQGYNWFASIGSCIFATGAMRLLRYIRLSRNPDKAADYDASLRDERTAYVANKARSAAFFLCMYAQLAAVLAAILIFEQPLIGKALCVLTCVQALTYTGCFWYYNRKY